MPNRTRPHRVTSDGSATLRWILAAAFAESPPDQPCPEPQPGIELASELALGARIANRWPSGELARLLPGAEIGTLLAARARALVASERVLGHLEAIAREAEGLEIPTVPLKWAAQLLAGDSLPGNRGAGDLDLLVSKPHLERLLLALAEKGWELARRGSEPHETALLFHPVWGTLDLHEHLPGIAAGSRAYAEFGPLEASGAFEPAPHPWPRSLRLPGRPLRLAHALTHGFRQHAGGFHRYAPFQFLGDAFDIARSASEGDWKEASLLARPSLPARDLETLRQLLAFLAAGKTPDPGSQGAAWLSHLLRASLEPTYQQRLIRKSLFSWPAGRGALRIFLLRLVRTVWPDASRLELRFGPARSIAEKLHRRWHHLRELAAKAHASLPNRRDPGPTP